MKPECVTERKDPLIVLKDPKGGRSKMTFINKKRELVKEVEVDGCEITEGKKCDFLILHPKKIKKEMVNDEYFVELKGKQVKYACEQLEASIRKLSENATQKPKHAIIIYTKNPLSLSQNQRLKTKFKKDFNAKLIINKKYTHKLS